MGISRSLKELLVQHYNMKAFIAIISTLLATANAEAEAEADPALLYANAYHGLGHYGYGYGLGYYGGYSGYPYYGYNTGVAAHPGAATSHVARSPQGLGKRSADAEPEADADADAAYYYGGYYGSGYGYPYGYGYGLASPYYGRHFNTGVAAHPGFGTSHTYRSVQGLGK